VKPWFFNNLQIRVTLVSLLVSLVPLVTVSVFSVRTANRVIEDIVQSQLENVAAEKQVLLERWIMERKADLEVLAGSPTVRNVDTEELASFFELAREQYGVYRRFVIAGLEGETVYDSSGPSDASNSNEVWFQSALRGEPYMSEAELEVNGKESVFRIATPIRDSGAQPLGVLCATVSTQAILERVLRLQLGESGECYLVDKAGTFLAHKDPRRILSESIAQSHSFTHIFSSEDEQPIYEDYRGILVLGASRSLEEIEWYIVVEQDRDEAFFDSDQLQRSIFIVVGLTVLGVVCLSALLAWYVASPIRSLSEAARTLARGDFEDALYFAQATRRDEIGALYVAFGHMADQLQDRHRLLETRVGLTQAELQKVTAELKETLDSAARAERLASLGHLASGVAHEIRTPLTSLKLFLQSVQENIAFSPDDREDYQIAMRQVARIEKTINRFLDFARPQEPVITEFNFAQLAAEVLEVIRPRASHQEIEIAENIASETACVRGDAHQLSEVLVNLLVNALDVMPDGGRLAVSVATEAAEPNSAVPFWVLVKVSDTGPGIPQQDLDRLFEPFFTTKATGSGLGLAILKSTVESHGGSVCVDTKLHAGTTFSIRLPTSSPGKTVENE
jgi:two-component system, NtrC family, sensor kinase